jgi:hypothetical protein
MGGLARGTLVLFVNAAVKQALRPPAIHEAIRRQVAPTQAQSKVGERPHDRNDDAEDAPERRSRRPALAWGIGWIVDRYV